MHKVRLPRWAVQRGADLNAFEALVPGRTALVVVDMQNIFMAEDQVYGNAHARDIVAWAQQRGDCAHDSAPTACTSCSWPAARR